MESSTIKLSTSAVLALAKLAKLALRAPYRGAGLNLRQVYLHAPTREDKTARWVATDGKVAIVAVFSTANLPGIEKFDGFGVGEDACKRVARAASRVGRIPKALEVELVYQERPSTPSTSWTRFSVTVRDKEGATNSPLEALFPIQGIKEYSRATFGSDKLYKCGQYYAPDVMDIAVQTVSPWDGQNYGEIPFPAVSRSGEAGVMLGDYGLKDADQLVVALVHPVHFPARDGQDPAPLFPELPERSVKAIKAVLDF